MSNMLFAHKNEVDDATSLAASSAVSGMPASYLQDAQRSLLWRSTAAGSQTIDVTLASDAEPIEVFALVDHNITLAGTVQVQAWTDALGGASEVYNQTLQPYQPVYGYGDLAYGSGLFGGFDTYVSGVSIAEAREVLRPILLKKITPAITARYWRVTFSDAGLSYYQAGRLWLGPAFTPTRNFGYGASLELETRTRRIESRGGQDYSNPRPMRTIINLSMEHAPDEDRDRLWLYYRRLGDSTPFIISLLPDGGYAQESTTFYVGFQRLRSSWQSYQGSQLPMTIREVL